MTIKRSLLYFLFALFGVLMFWEVVKKQNFSEILHQLYLADYSWAFLVLVVTIINHIIRALRWQLLFKPLGYKPTLINTLVAMIFGYFVSLGIPRIGEISRCIALERSENIPFNISVGTVFTERFIDIICLFILIIGVFLFQHTAFEAILMKFVISPLQMLFIENKLKSFALIFIILSILIGVCYLIIEKFKNNIFSKKVYLFFNQLKSGALSVFNLKEKYLFILYTISIWIAYFLMTYLWFPSLKATSQLNWQAGFTLLVIGSLGKSVPVQGGGFGAYHFLITQTLIYLGVAGQFGFTLAMIIHGFQTCFYLIMGVLSWLYILVQNNKNTSPSQEL